MKSNLFTKLLSLFTVFTLILSTFMIGGKNTEAATTKVFKDIDTSYTYIKEINFLIEKGVLTASTTTNFNPKAKATRYDTIEFIGNALGYKKTQEATKFKDVAKTHKLSGYINQSVANGITNGYDDKTFRGGNTLTRAEASAFISRAFKLTKTANITFKDVPEKAYYAQNVKQLYAHKITFGYGDNTFRPNNSVTREELALFVARAMGYDATAQTTTPVETKPTTPTTPVVTTPIAPTDYTKFTGKKGTNFNVYVINYKENVYLIEDEKKQYTLVNTGSDMAKIEDAMKELNITKFYGIIISKPNNNNLLSKVLDTYNVQIVLHADNLPKTHSVAKTLANYNKVYVGILKQAGFTYISDKILIKALGSSSDSSLTFQVGVMNVSNVIFFNNYNDTLFTNNTKDLLNATLANQATASIVDEETAKQLSMKNLFYNRFGGVKMKNVYSYNNNVTFVQNVNKNGSHKALVNKMIIEY